MEIELADMTRKHQEEEPCPYHEWISDLESDIAHAQYIYHSSVARLEELESPSFSDRDDGLCESIKMSLRWNIRMCEDCLKFYDSLLLQFQYLQTAPKTNSSLLEL